jgi:hypothetical protein
MKGDLLRTKELYETLNDLAGKKEYAIIGPAGLYLRTLPLVQYEPVFIPFLIIDVIYSGSNGLNKIGLSGFENVFVKSASLVSFDKYEFCVASPLHLALEYLMRERLGVDLCSFVKAGGDIEPEQLRNLLKSVRSQDLFYEHVLPMLYDFGNYKLEEISR